MNCLCENITCPLNSLIKPPLHTQKFVINFQATKKFPQYSSKGADFPLRIFTALWRIFRNAWNFCDKCRIEWMKFSSPFYLPASHSYNSKSINVLFSKVYSISYVDSFYLYFIPCHTHLGTYKYEKIVIYVILLRILIYIYFFINFVPLRIVLW